MRTEKGPGCSSDVACGNGADEDAVDIEIRPVGMWQLWRWDLVVGIGWGWRYGDEICEDVAYGVVVGTETGSL